MKISRYLESIFPDSQLHPSFNIIDFLKSIASVLLILLYTKIIVKIVCHPLWPAASLWCIWSMQMIRTPNSFGPTKFMSTQVY